MYDDIEKVIVFDNHTIDIRWKFDVDFKDNHTQSKTNSFKPNCWFYFAFGVLITPAINASKMQKMAKKL